MGLEQARSQEFALGGGLFWIVEKMLNDLDPDFTQSLISLSRFFFVQNEVKSKKKVFNGNSDGYSGHN